jgi:hypothetical protein
MADFSTFEAEKSAKRPRIEASTANATLQANIGDSSASTGALAPSATQTATAASTADGGSKIVAMSASTRQRICSDQVIVDLPSVLKELIENSLDAGATKIDVRVKDHGVHMLEVSDNGKGIRTADLAGVALRHHTSKISQFDDLERLKSFGFRGEALNSLATLASLSMSTRAAADPIGTAISYGPGGEVISRTTLARDVGTTATVEDLFAPFPVRRKTLERTAYVAMRARHLPSPSFFHTPRYGPRTRPVVSTATLAFSCPQVQRIS